MNVAKRARLRDLFAAALKLGLLEQASLGAEDIAAKTDDYFLGVLLYQLVSGTLHQR